MPLESLWEQNAVSEWRKRAKKGVAGAAPHNSPYAGTNEAALANPTEIPSA
jgi:hypothetical protein